MLLVRRGRVDDILASGRPADRGCGRLALPQGPLSSAGMCRCCHGYQPFSCSMCEGNESFASFKVQTLMINRLGITAAQHLVRHDVQGEAIGERQHRSFRAWGPPASEQCENICCPVATSGSHHAPVSVASVPSKLPYCRARRLDVNSDLLGLLRTWPCRHSFGSGRSARPSPVAFLATCYGERVRLAQLRRTQSSPSPGPRTRSTPWVRRAASWSPCRTRWSHR